MEWNYTKRSLPKEKGFYQVELTDPFKRRDPVFSTLYFDPSLGWETPVFFKEDGTLDLRPLDITYWGEKISDHRHI